MPPRGRTPPLVGLEKAIRESDITTLWATCLYEAALAKKRGDGFRQRAMQATAKALHPFAEEESRALRALAKPTT